jgi:flagellar biosynthetic protein FlhB
MAEDTDPQSKTEQPTQRRLDEARRQGDVAKSPDLPQWASITAVTGVLVLAGGWLSRDLMEALLPFIAHPDGFSLDHGGGQIVMRHAIDAALPVLVVVMGTAAAAGAAGNLIQTGFIWAPGKAKPDFGKISIFAGFKRVFGLDGFVHFGKSLAKAIVIGAVCWMSLKPHVHELENLTLLDPVAMMPFMLGLLKDLLFSVLGVLGVAAIVDWLYQRQRFMQRMRMSREEVKDDMRQAEGDPHVRNRQRQIRLNRSRQRMIQNVPKATVVVMNPTHYAVALRYDANETPAPLCVAKGMDKIALRIREVAEAHNVPVIEDAPLARALFATVEVEQTIPREHYEAVAKVIGFVLGAGRKRARAAR